MFDVAPCTAGIFPVAEAGSLKFGTSVAEAAAAEESILRRVTEWPMRSESTARGSVTRATQEQEKRSICASIYLVLEKRAFAISATFGERE